LKRIHADVQSGKPLSAALSANGDCFDPLYVNLVRAGEAGGALAVVMERLAVHRERTDAFNATLVSALTYPVVLVCVAAISLFVLLTFVIPRFIPLFADAGETLPLLTEVVFGLARLLQQGWWLLFGAIVLAKILADRWLARPGNRLRLDRSTLRLPVVGEIVLLTETVRFTRTLATLQRNGLPLLTSLKHVRDVQRNSVVASAIDDAVDRVRGGRRLAAALEHAGVFPDLAIEFITIGEESGRLEDMLEKVADTFQLRAEQRLKRLLTLLEPALILGLGAAIAIVIVSILLAMLGLNELVV
jgi:general secretion pathway protein F